MKTINALGARSRLGTLLDEVSQTGIHYVIERLSRPLVVMIPFKEYKDYVKTVNGKDMKDAKQELLEEILVFRKKYGKKYASGEDSTSLTRQFRNSR